MIYLTLYKMIKIFRSFPTSCLSFCLNFVFDKSLKYHFNMRPSANSHFSLPGLKKLFIVNVFVIAYFLKTALIKSVPRNIASIYKVKILNS